MVLRRMSEKKMILIFDIDICKNHEYQIQHISVSWRDTKVRFEQWMTISKEPCHEEFLLAKDSSSNIELNFDFEHKTNEYMW